MTYFFIQTMSHLRRFRPFAKFGSGMRMAALTIVGLMSANIAIANPYDENMTLRLLPGWRAADGTHVAGLEMTLAKGWKTYWRSPGEAGIPPAFSWSGSGNLSAVEVIWPRPVVFDQNGLRSIGYANRVVLPLVLTPSEPDAEITLRGNIRVGICDEVCVPLELTIAASLPAGSGKRDPAIVAAMATRPFSAREGKVAGVSCDVSPGKTGLALSVDIDMPSTGGDETIVVETRDPQVWASDARSKRSGGRISGSAELVHATGGGFALDRSGITITVLGRDLAVQIDGCS